MEGILLDFRVEIRGNPDETGDEAEVSTLIIAIPLKSEKVLYRNSGSLF